MDEKEVVAWQAKAFSAAAREMRQLEELTDVALVCGATRFMCHRAVLAAASNYFRSLFHSGMKDSALPTVSLELLDPVAVRIVVDVMYGGDFTTPKDRLQLKSLIEAADFLQMRALFDFLCERYLAFLNSDEFADVMSAACVFQNKVMMSKVLDFLVVNLIGVVSAGDFVLLDFSELKELAVAATARRAPSELIVDGILAWVKSDVDGRKAKLLQLFRLVDLTTLSSNYIARLIEREELVRSSVDLMPMLMAEATSRMLRANNDEDVRLFFFGDSDEAFTSMQYFDFKSREWSCCLNLPFQLPDVGYVAPAYLNGDVLLLGGQNAKGEISAAVYKYTPFSASLAKMPNMMLQARTAPWASTLHGKVYCVGGRRKHEVFQRTVECFNPYTGLWENAPSTSHAYYNPNVVTIDDALYVVDSKDYVIEEFTDSQWKLISPPPGLGYPELYYWQVPVVGCLGHLFVYFRDKSLWSYDVKAREWKKRDCEIGKEVIKGMWSVCTKAKHLPYLLILDEKGSLTRYDLDTNTLTAYPGSLSFMGSSWIDVIVT